MTMKEATLEKVSVSAAMPTSSWHTQEAASILQQLAVKTDEGLDTATVAKRIETYGTNVWRHDAESDSHEERSADGMATLPGEVP